VSKRHQANRRRAYGRRLHEVHERHERRPDRERPELAWDASDDSLQIDPLAFLDPRAPRPRFDFAD
jgi:hypothetical protein